MFVLRPFAFLESGYRHRALISRLAWRRLQTRYRGSVMGAVWLFLQPILLLGIYTLVFSLLFEARWGQTLAGRGEFGLFLFSGVLLYSIFSECVNEAPGLMLKHEPYIVQIRFPIEILPWVSLASSLYLFFFGSAVLLVFHLLVLGVPPASWLILPVVLVPIALFTLGVTWFVSSVGVYFRDLSQLTVMFTTALLFLSPVFYPASRIPESLRTMYDLNPFAVLLEASKHLLFFGDAPNWGGLALVGLVSFVVAVLGHAWFMHSKRGFADVV
ncbi:MAG: ABC transporter permease [bacterium]|nr:ABC transporter permease [bacterium]